MRNNKRARSLIGLGVVSVMVLSSVMMATPAQAVTLAPLTGEYPTIIVVDQNLQQVVNPITGAAQDYPQVGLLVMVKPGKWNVPDDQIVFTFQWQRVDTGTGVATDVCTSNNTCRARDYGPLSTDIGYRLQAVMTASHAGDTSTQVIVPMAKPVVGLNANQVLPYSSYTNNAYRQPPPVGPAPGWAKGWFTQFGWPDNTPPSGNIANGGTAGLTYPHTSNNGIHGGSAGGDGWNGGSYDHPITMAGSTSIIPAGMEIYSPRRGKYYILEDSCTECTRDLQGNGRDQDPDYPAAGNWIQAEGPNGGPSLVHFDQWIGGQHTDWPDLIICEDALTLGDENGPYMEDFIVNPASDEWFNPFPVYFEGDPKQFTDPANADPEDVTPHCGYEERPVGGQTVVSETDMTENAIVGPIVSQVSGLCLTNPGNSTDVGTRLTMEPCDGSASQNFTFSGLFLISNNLCADMGNGMGSNGTSSTLNATWNSLSTGASTTYNATARWATLQKCNMNPRQQWEMSYDGSITDIQNGSYALADGLDGYAYFSNTGSSIKDINLWNWSWGGDQNAQLAVEIDPANGLDTGSDVTVKASGLTTPVANILLVSDDGQFSYTLAEGVEANADGTIEAQVKIPDQVGHGNYSILVQGDFRTDESADIPYPAPPLQSNGTSTGITAQSQLSVAGATLQNFRLVDRTEAISGRSGGFPLGGPITPHDGNGGASNVDTGGSVVGAGSPLAAGLFGTIALLGIGLAIFRRREMTIGR